MAKLSFWISIGHDEPSRIAQKSGRNNFSVHFYMNMDYVLSESSNSVNIKQVCLSWLSVIGEKMIGSDIFLLYFWPVHMRVRHISFLTQYAVKVGHF